MERFRYERECLARGILRVAGVDEAGRGPLAGPVVAAAVLFPPAWVRDGLPAELGGLNDSKQLSAARREAYFGFLLSARGTEAGVGLAVGVAVVEAEEIDRLNILRATHAGMARALSALNPAPDHILVDGLPVDSLTIPQTAIVKGDSLSFSIAAASVMAKVTRDRLMVEHDLRWPEYGFAVHKGYPTPRHREVLRRLGPCPIHRRSFAPVEAAQLDLFGP